MTPEKQYKRAVTIFQMLLRTVGNDKPDLIIAIMAARKELDTMYKSILEETTDEKSRNIS